MTNETGRLKANPQSQASEELCHIQTLGTLVKWSETLKKTAQSTKEINKTANTKGSTDGQT